VKVFLSYAVGPGDTPIAARLRAVAAAYDIAILLPDRTQIIHNGLPVDTQEKIKKSDAVIALVTNTTTPEAIHVVNNELQIATEARKPVIGLVEVGGVQIQPAPDTQVVYFDRSNPTAHETYLMDALEHIRQQKSKNDFTALGWIAGIALGLIALGSLLGDEE
jgi:hypothetical protein